MKHRFDLRAGGFGSGKNWYCTSTGLVIYTPFPNVKVVNKFTFQSILVQSFTVSIFVSIYNQKWKEYLLFIFKIRSIMNSLEQYNQTI